MRPKNSINLTNLRITDKFYVTNSFGVSSSAGSITSGTVETNFSYVDTTDEISVEIPTGSDLLLFENYSYVNSGGNIGDYEIIKGAVTNITTTPVLFLAENYSNLDITSIALSGSSTSTNIILDLTKVATYETVTSFTKYSVVKL